MLINNRETWALVHFCLRFCDAMIEKSTREPLMRRRRHVLSEQCRASIHWSGDSECLCYGGTLISDALTQYLQGNVFLPSSLYRLSTKPRTATLHPEPIVWIWMATLHENWDEPCGGIPAWQWRASPHTIHQPRTSNACIVYPLPKDARAPLTRVTGDLLSFSGMY